jgi:HEPN domain-containing protein
MSVQRRIAAFFDLAMQDLDAASLLAEHANRYAPYHVQQAVEKMLKAVLLHRNVEAGVDHRLDVLVGKLADSDPWKSAFRPFERYTPYATTYRYPTPGGRTAPAPPPQGLIEDIAAIRVLLDRARRELAG